MNDKKNIMKSKPQPTSQDTIFLSQLAVNCIVGIFDWERNKKQKVLIDLEIPCDVKRAASTDGIEDTIDYKTIAKGVFQLVQKSKYFLIESLAESVANHILTHSALSWVSVTVSKPGAIRFSRNVGVHITRFRKHSGTRKREVIAYLSVGSNQKPQMSIPKSIQLLKEAFGECRISNTYESTAIGPKSQPPFWNLMLEISTTLSPLQLKQRLLQMEKTMGRKRSKNKYAARYIDLDIVFYGNQSFKAKGLQIPHTDSSTAPYVLLPMLELNPGYRHPTLRQSILEIVGSKFDARAKFKKVSLHK